MIIKILFTILLFIPSVIMADVDREYIKQVEATIDQLIVQRNIYKNIETLHYKLTKQTEEQVLIYQKVLNSSEVNWNGVNWLKSGQVNWSKY